MINDPSEATSSSQSVTSDIDTLLEMIAARDACHADRVGQSSRHAADYITIPLAIIGTAGAITYSLVTFQLFAGTQALHDLFDDAQQNAIGFISIGSLAVGMAGLAARELFHPHSSQIAKETHLAKTMDEEIYLFAQEKNIPGPVHKYETTPATVTERQLRLEAFRVSKNLSDFGDTRGFDLLKPSL